MKKYLLLALLAFAPLTSYAGSPFLPEADTRFEAVEEDIETLEDLPSSQSYSGTGVLSLRVARAVYDVAVHGGGTGAHDLEVALPAKAIITKSWFQVNTQFADAGSGTVALSCEDANNIYTAADITGNAAGTLVEGRSTGAFGSYISSIGAACNITATVATAAQSAGKLTLFVEYLVGQ